MKLNQILPAPTPCPFAMSADKRVFYHGSKAEFGTFNRPSHGIYVTPSQSWAEAHYGNRIYAVYANVSRVYRPTEEEIDIFYDVEYEKIAILLERLSTQGYNCAMFGGESESMVLFNNIELVDATTGKPM